MPTETQPLRLGEWLQRHAQEYFSEVTVWTPGSSGPYAAPLQLEVKTIRVIDAYNLARMMTDYDAHIDELFKL